MHRTELEHLSVKSTLYTLNTYPTGQYFGPFCSTSTCSGLQDTRLKIGKALNNPKLNLTIKSTLYTLKTYPRDPGQILICFAL